MKRRTVLGAALGLGAASVAGCSAASKAKSTGTDSGPSSLDFDKDAFKTLTTTVTTDAGDKKVTYHFYAAVPYVANPTDEDHQSLIVSVPVEIDGKAVDASNAPILFANSVGGYFPASVATAAGVGEAKMEMGGMSGAPGGGMPPGGAPDGAGPEGGGPEGGGPGGAGPGGGAPGGDANAMRGAGGGQISLPKLALAAGYVVVEPGVRGRTLKDGAGNYYGTAPAAIVDLKAAVRYVKHNKGKIPGNVDHIVSSGVSAGGALSALVGASGDSPLYDGLLKALGAADASDGVFASADWCPITDLEHADMAYEWNWGGLEEQGSGKVVDQEVSAELKTAYTGYLAGLKLKGLNGYGTITAANLDDYLLKTYLQPSATRYLAARPSDKRSSYLSDNPWITWSGGKATFTWAKYLDHVGQRKKTVPAFDGFKLEAGENNEFGLDTTMARHFTLYSLREATGSTSKQLDADLPEKINLMNPMYFVGRKNPGRAKHWWIRVGTRDTDTALTVVANLAAGLAALGDDVDSIMYWDGAHGANEDPADFVKWIAEVTGYTG